MLTLLDADATWLIDDLAILGLCAGERKCKQGAASEKDVGEFQA
jgi:hypothetical protein